MTRAIRLTCLSLLAVAMAAGVALARPSVAVLGLEVIDKSGTPTPVDTNVASELTQGLRARAKAGTGPYQIAPGSDKELIDEKLLKNCDDEKPSCMSAIGAELNAEFLMYGRIEKIGGAYNVTVVLLDVKRKLREKTYPDSIPISDASGAALQGWAKKIYAKLTGQPDTCTIIVHTNGVDRGTILVDGAEKGSITNGTGQVSLPENRYRISVEAQDYHRWDKPDVTCTAGGTSNLDAVMEPSDGGTGPGGTLGQTGSVSHPSNKGIWKAMAWGGLIGTAVGGGVWLVGYTQYTQKAKFTTDDINNIITAPGSGITDTNPADYTDAKCGTPDGNIIAAANANFDKGCKGKTWTKVGVGLTIGFGVVAAVGFVMAYARGDHEEKPVSVTGTATVSAGHRARKRPPFVIVPVVGPNGGGATFAMEW